MPYTLQQAREMKGLTRKDLATASGISLSAIGRIENSEPMIHSTNVATARALADALGMKLGDIVWPRGISELGRPPHSGGSVVRRTTITHTTTIITEEVVMPEVYMICFTTVANNGECLCNT